MAEGTRVQWGRPLLGFDLAGVPELVEALAILEELGSAKLVLERALKVSSKPMKAAGQEEAPVRFGILRGAVQIVKAKRKGKHQARYFFTCVAPHAHLVHDGTTDRRVKTTGQYTGKITRPNPFMQRAYDRTADVVLAGFARQLGTELVKLSRRIQRKISKGTTGKGMTRRLTR